MKKIKNIFYINTVYSLLIALMLKPNLEENLYFFNDDFSEEIIKNFKNKIILRKYRKKIKILRYYKIRSFLKKIIKNYKKELLGKDFFMQDHLTFSQFFLNNFDKIYIKPHPREKTDYEKIFSEYGVQIIEKNFPIELLNFLQIKFIKIITIFSTAAFNFKDSCEIEFIGTENYPKLYKKFGKIEFKERN